MQLLPATIWDYNYGVKKGYTKSFQSALSIFFSMIFDFDTTHIFIFIKNIYLWLKYYLMLTFRIRMQKGAYILGERNNCEEDISVCEKTEEKKIYF